MGRRAFLWKGPGSLVLRGGVRDEVLVAPYDPEAGTSGMVHLPKNVAAVDAMGQERLASLKAAGSLVEFMEYDGPERRVQERRQTERRRN